MGRPFLLRRRTQEKPEERNTYSWEKYPEERNHVRSQVPSGGAEDAFRPEERTFLLEFGM